MSHRGSPSPGLRSQGQARASGAQLARLRQAPGQRHLACGRAQPDEVKALRRGQSLTKHDREADRSAWQGRLPRPPPDAALKVVAKPAASRPRSASKPCRQGRCGTRSEARRCRTGRQAAAKQPRRRSRLAAETPPSRLPPAGTPRRRLRPRTGSATAPRPPRHSVRFLHEQEPGPVPGFCIPGQASR